MNLHTKRSYCQVKVIPEQPSSNRNPHVPTYFFSNSPVKCRFTKVVLPTPPSPTKINLNSGTACFTTKPHVSHLTLTNIQSQPLTPYHLRRVQRNGARNTYNLSLCPIHAAGSILFTMNTQGQSMPAKANAQHSSVITLNPTLIMKGWFDSIGKLFASLEL